MEDLLKKLKKFNIALSVSNNDLKVKFNDPSLPDDLVREIKENKSRLIAYLTGLDRDIQDKDIEPLGPQECYPLSSSQLRLWTLSQLDGDMTAYNMGSFHQFEGDLNVPALEYAFQAIVTRHEVLRTVFRKDDKGEIHQYIQPPPAGSNIGCHDIRREGMTQEELKAVLRSSFIQPFDLSSGPLLRADLYQVADRTWIFAHVMHHIVSDGWSNNILVRELLTLYNARVRGEATPLLPLRIQYKDYAAWQQARMKEGSARGHRAYWLEQLSQPLPVLKLPGDKVRPAVKSNAGATLGMTLSPELSKELLTFCQEQKSTLFMGLLAGVNILMYRYTGHEDIIIGSPVAGRSHKDLEDQIGFYLNTIAFRTRFKGGGTVRELLAATRELTLQAYEHQEYPFDELLDELKLKRDLSRDALFDVMILLANAALPASGQEQQGLEGIRVEPYDAGEAPISKYDLTFYFGDAGGQVRVSIEYNTDIFNRDTIERMGQRFEQMVKWMVSDPELTIDSVVSRSIGGKPRPITLGGPVSGKVECSEHQRRLWFIDQFEKNYLYDKSPVYHNLPLILQFPGIPDVPALNVAIEGTVRRHPALRTRIVNENSVPYQQVEEEMPAEVQIHRLAGSPPPAADSPPPAELEAKCLTIAEQPFDVEKGPLIRFDLVIDDHGSSCFVITAHHLIVDRTALWLVGEHILMAYAGRLIIGKEKPALEYTRYTEWQNGLTAIDLEAETFYWKKKLKGAPVFYLETDHPREHIHVYKAGHCKRVLPSELSREIERFCSDRGESPSLFLLTAFNILLYRYTGSEEIVIGTMYENREQKEWRSTIGPVANLITLRNRLGGDLHFGPLLDQVGRDYKEAVSHADIPFEKVVLELNPEKDMSRTALFDVLFHYYRVAVGTVPGGGQLGAVRRLELNRGIGKYDLNLLIGHGRELELILTYNDRYFSRPRMERLADHYITLLEQLVKAPATAIGKIDYLSSAEKERLLAGGEDRHYEYHREKTIIHLWMEQVAVTPDLPALVYEGSVLSYRRLNTESNRLAHYLREDCGIQREELVGIRLERSEWLVVAILAILKSGGAYVPIDPEYPAERSDFMIRDSGCRVVIDDQELQKFREAAGQYGEEDPDLVCRPQDLAYVIYTSGTTGNPKGALVDHSNVVRLLKTEGALFDFGDADTWTLFHSFCFDFSVWEIFGALLNGGKLIVVPSMTAKDPQAFIGLLTREKVTVLNQTPSSFYQLIREEMKKKDAMLGLRYVIFGGEALNAGKLGEWHDRYPGTKLINMYGITETTVHVTYKEIGTAEITGRGCNIGKPIPTLQCYLLDERKQLVPAGVPGELYVGGEGVCRGYLNRKELTDARFVEDPYKKGQRLYRSGDKAKLLENGEMEFLGRIDDQVKVRGYRIETGEIEHALLANDQIDEAVVMIRDNRGEMGLVAYIVGKEPLDLKQIRSELALLLPAYMIPERFVSLEKIPLTANGKVDKTALPEPGELSLGIEYTAPRNKTEEGLAEIWQDILGIGRIGIKDNFFDRGGHSLKATRLVNQIHKKFDVKITLKELFAHPVLEEQACLLRLAAKTSFERISPAAGGTDYPLSSSQRRLWVLDQLAKGNIAYNMPDALMIEGELDPQALEHSFRQLISRHESLRTEFRINAQGDVRQSIRQPEDVGFRLDYRDLRYETEQQPRVKEGVMMVLTRPFHLTTAPLLRASLFRIDHAKYVFAYVTHHIISDGWSMEVLFREALDFYRAYAGNGETRLHPLRIQYKDYAVWQQQQLERGGFERQRRYWLNQFSGDLPVLHLPIAGPRPEVKTYNGRTLHRTIGSSLSEGLKSLYREGEGTLFIGLLATVNALLYRYSGQEDIIVGSPIAGREHADLEDQIGFYVNTIALRTTFSGNSSFRELLHIVREVSMGAYANQAYPFDELIDELDLPRDMSRTPLFDVMVMLQNAETGDTLPPAQEGDMKIRRFESEEILMSKFDISFAFAEAGEEVIMNIEYNTDIYDAAGMERLADHFVQLLGAIISDPAMPICRLDYLNAKEKFQLVTSFNDTSGKVHAGQVIELFEQQVGRTPDDVAVEFREDLLTYRQLNAIANQFSDYLRKNYSIRPDDLVGIKLDRSQWLIIALLGVLKSGGAYLPVDPDYPEDRVAYLLSDSGCKLMIDAAEVEKFRASRESYSGDNPATRGKGDDLVYVIYTSGSTGGPKGCAIANASLVNYIQWAKSFYFGGLAKADFGLFTSISFDLTATSIFCCLTNGGRLHVYSQQQDIQQIFRHSFSKGSGIDSVKLTPSHISLLKQMNLESPALSCAIVGGEAMTAEHVNILRKINPAVKIYNEYGPTEATIGCIVGELDSNEPIHIGKPIANTEIRILDDSGELCPVNVPGIIHIAGACLGRGYLNRPELTAKKFLPDPLQPDRKMYETGDLGAWLPDGNINFLGRKDDQVKIRGYRIELNEVEDALRGHPGIDSAAVVARTDADGGKELVGYLVSTKTMHSSELREYMAAMLPAYMIPSYFVQLEELPLTKNGKLDKKRLHAPGGMEMPTGTEYLGARNTVEEQLIRIWEEILRRDNIGIGDNFFDLGGNSLKLIKMINMVNRMLDRNISVVNAFRFPSIERLSAFIDENASPVQESEEALKESLDVMETTFNSLNYAIGEN